MCDFSIEVSDALRLVKDPLVSVIMVTYNHERYLAEAIEGVVRQQTSFPIELLIGEDCSTDGTRKVALEYQMRFPETIRVLSSKFNVGGHKNQERLFGAARGKYIAFCEGDDFWHRTDKLMKQVAALEANPRLSFACSSFRRVTSDGGILKEDDLLGTVRRKEPLSYDDILLMSVVGTLTVCARRHLVLKAFSESPECRDPSLLMGDLPLWLQLSQYGDIWYDPVPLASYRLTERSASRKSDPLWARRFGMNAREIRYQFLSRYPLKSGPGETRFHLLRIVRDMLVDAAIIGAPDVADVQLQRLRQLGEEPGIREIVLKHAACLSLPVRVDLPDLKGKLSLWVSRIRSRIYSRSPMRKAQCGRG